MTNWSKREVETYAKLSGIKYKCEGSGFVYSQSIEKDTKITDEELIVKLK